MKSITNASTSWASINFIFILFNHKHAMKQCDEQTEQWTLDVHWIVNCVQTIVEIRNDKKKKIITKLFFPRNTHTKRMNRYFGKYWKEMRWIFNDVSNPIEKLSLSSDGMLLNHVENYPNKWNVEYECRFIYNMFVYLLKETEKLFNVKRDQTTLNEMIWMSICMAVVNGWLYKKKLNSVYFRKH